MTAEILREAANALRVDASVGYQRGHISMREVRFKRAVADLLDAQADEIGDLAPRLTWEAVDDAALNVASVYLGESS